MKEFLKRLGRSATGRRGIGNTVTVAIIIAVVLLNILAYTLTNAFGLYFYSPEVSDLSISGSTDELFANAILLGKKVTVTFCYAEDKLEKHDTGSLVLTTAREFEKRYPELIDLRFVSLLTKMDEDGVIVDFDKYLEGGKNKLKQNSVIFESGEGEEWSCRVITDMATSAGFVDFYTLDASANIVSYNGEEVMAAMISWVLHDEHPVAYLTQNHGETADVAFSNLLTCAGFYVEVINLRKSEIPDDAGMIIISNPTSDFELSVENAEVRGELNKLEAYLERGGKLYVALDPYVKELKNLEGMLKKWGITLSGDYDDNGVLVRNIVRESSNAITTDGYTFVATHADNDVASKILSKVETYGDDNILMSEVTRLELDPSLGAAPLLVSGTTSTTHAGGKLTDSEGSYAVAAYSKRSERDGSESTVFVIPTAYATASDALLSDSYSNKDFLYSVLEVLFDSNPAPRGCNRVTYRTSIIENLTMGSAKAYTAIILAIPAALAVFGTVTIIRRKNR
jgi:hypothetical protein